MKYAIEMGLGAMIYIYIYTKFRKDRLRHSKADRGKYTATQIHR
jgi:hypothetical protein